MDPNSPYLTSNKYCNEISDLLDEFLKDDEKFLAEHPDLTPDQREHMLLTLLMEYGNFDGSHHKQWVLDQAVRLISGEHYDRVVNAWAFGVNADKLSPEEMSQRIQEGNYYSWDTGIAP